MKLVSFIYNAVSSYGIVKPEGIIDLGKYLKPNIKDLKSLLEASPDLQLAREFLHRRADIPVSSVLFLPVIEHPDKIICAGMNYMDKRREFAQQNPALTLFIRFPDSQTGHNTPVLKTNETEQFDYEGELAVIIGAGGRNITVSEALRHVSGYSCYMDGSVRDWQHSWFTAGKNWPKTGAFGPWMITSDEIANPHDLTIRTILNGVEVQHDNTGNMIHKIPEIIAYISRFTALSAGDVIITGSPGGVGKSRTPPLFMKSGDCIEVCIDKIGRLRNTVLEY